LGVGNLNPGGGGPWDVAYRDAVVERERAATVAARGLRELMRSMAAVGRLRASIINGLVEAILRARDPARGAVVGAIGVGWWWFRDEM